MIADRIPGPLGRRRRSDAKDELSFEHILAQPPGGSLRAPAPTTAKLPKGTGKQLILIEVETLRTHAHSLPQAPVHRCG